MIENIFNELEKWMDGKGNGDYFADYLTENHCGTRPIEAIQQNKKEIKEFVDLLLKKSIKGTILEIGLGYWGSTHFLWRLIFDKIITIETNYDRIRQFGLNTQKYYGEWVLDDNRSFFIHGDSSKPSTVSSLYKLLDSDKCDVLFIDGLHTYEAVFTDWLLYNQKVKDGGIVVFHDYNLKCIGKFIDELENGDVDGKSYEVNKIIYSNTQGIAWYKT